MNNIACVQNSAGTKYIISVFLSLHLAAQYKPICKSQQRWQQQQQFHLWMNTNFSNLTNGDKKANTRTKDGEKHKLCELTQKNQSCFMNWFDFIRHLLCVPLCDHHFRVWKSTRVNELIHFLPFHRTKVCQEWCTFQKFDYKMNPEKSSSMTLSSSAAVAAIVLCVVVIWKFQVFWRKKSFSI